MRGATAWVALVGAAGCAVSSPPADVVVRIDEVAAVASASVAPAVEARDTGFLLDAENARLRGYEATAGGIELAFLRSLAWDLAFLELRVAPWPAQTPGTRAMADRVKGRAPAGPFALDVARRRDAIEMRSHDRAGGVFPQALDKAGHQVSGFVQSVSTDTSRVYWLRPLTKCRRLASIGAVIADRDRLRAELALAEKGAAEADDTELARGPTRAEVIVALLRAIAFTPVLALATLGTLDQAGLLAAVEQVPGPGGLWRVVGTVALLVFGAGVATKLRVRPARLVRRTVFERGRRALPLALLFAIGLQLTIYEGVVARSWVLSLLGLCSPPGKL